VEEKKGDEEQKSAWKATMIAEFSSSGLKVLMRLAYSFPS